MILKEADDRSGDIAELKRLKEASPVSFHPAIQKQIDNIYAGLSGESDAAHFLNRKFGKSKEVALLHDLRIGVDGDYGQIDHLMIHRIRATAWLLATKNYSGRMSCDEDGDWTAWRNGKPIPIASPVNQASRHCEILRQWLDANDIKAIRTFHPVVLISPTSSVDRRKLSPKSHVVKSDNFSEWYDKQTDAIGVGSAFAIVGQHLLSGISHEEFKSIGEQLAAAHVPSSFDWRAKLRLPQASASTETRTAVPSMAPQTPDPTTSNTAHAAQVLSTPHGEVKITRLPDGRYALRNDNNEALIELVKGACKGNGYWNARFRNWLIAPDRLPSVVAAISGATATGASSST